MSTPKRDHNEAAGPAVETMAEPRQRFAGNSPEWASPKTGQKAHVEDIDQEEEGNEYQEV